MSVPGVHDGEREVHDARRSQPTLTHISGRNANACSQTPAAVRRCAANSLLVLLCLSHIVHSGALLDNVSPIPNLALKPPSWKSSSTFLPGFDPTGMVAPVKALLDSSILAPDMVLPAVTNPALHLGGLIMAAKNFAVGAVSGWSSSFIMFPIDMAKTRIQDEHVIKGAEPLYRNIFQTIWKVGNEEGVRSVYHGYIPVLLGSAPQGILQVGTNDFVRRSLSNQKGCTMDQLDLSSEILAGAASGFMQVFATSPMERVKILQQANGASSGNIVQIIDQIGVKGLFAGATACWMRDIPFCALYFPIYQRTKQWMVDRDSHATKADGSRSATLWDSLVAGIAAGVPAAMTTCPLDVIKTRMQSCGISVRGCDVSANSVRGTAAELWAEGGVGAFFKGLTGRVGRVAPQLAICLAIYDALSGLLLKDDDKKAAQASG